MAVVALVGPAPDLAFAARISDRQRSRSSSGESASISCSSSSLPYSLTVVTPGMVESHAVLLLLLFVVVEEVGAAAAAVAEEEEAEVPLTTSAHVRRAASGAGGMGDSSPPMANTLPCGRLREAMGVVAPLDVPVAEDEDAGGGGNSAGDSTAATLSGVVNVDTRRALACSSPDGGGVAVAVAVVVVAVVDPVLGSMLNASASTATTLSALACCGGALISAPSPVSLLPRQGTQGQGGKSRLP